MRGGGGELVENLFRQEAGRLAAALTRILGLHNLALAEDLVQETLCDALETWKFGRVPDNPTAWLVRCARNRAIDAIRREKVRRRFAADVGPLLESEWTLVPTVDRLFSDGEIADDQLRMMFACCQGESPPEVQVALILKILCGFSVGEIAAAFLASEAAVEKQLSRGKQALQRAGELAEIGPVEIAERLDAVHRALYLLFNEGYHASAEAAPVRDDLCREAIRLGELLAAHPIAGTPQSHALVGLFCLHAARLPARVDGEGTLVLLSAQDRRRWDGALIARGMSHLACSGAGAELGEYHVEAAIAAHHAAAESFEATDWRGILRLYDLLLRMRPSPVVALNRAIVVGQLDGPAAGLAALDAIEGRERLAAYPFWFAARGDFQLALGRTDEAIAELRQARALARNPSEARLLDAKLQACGIDGAHREGQTPRHHDAKKS
jgi:RNA polymerase sigma-70 factor (ECF subfamily)